MIFAAITRLLAAAGLSNRLASRLAPWVAGAIAIALVASVMGLAVHFVNRAFDSAREAGVQAERAETAQQIIEQMEQANEARDDNLNRTDDQRIADCLRRSRTPENC
jgi:divalent metal cation (Fe/Co/Zn/Cd) transporter